MVATLMQALDGTIANVALPYMQGSLAATADQITWVLTSYVIAAAIMTAPVGWLARCFGRRRVFLASVGGFTLASVLCGAAQNLEQMVLFRLLQGLFGAALVPLSQATMLDLYTPAERGRAMAIWGIGVMVGPIMGPTLGGLLTDAYSWRWVFYVNLPFGTLACLGLALFMAPDRRTEEVRFDWVGFASLGLGIGALQFMLDRGELKDWFGSREIWAEAVLGGLSLWIFLVHMATAERPFLPRALFADRNFLAGIGVMLFVGAILLASAALLAPYMQVLGGYPVLTAGLLLAPRGIGTIGAMLLGGRLANRIDPRRLMLAGVLLLAWSLHEMAYWTPAVDARTLGVMTTIQGFALGLVFLPLQLVAFATLPAWLRTDATAVFSLLRNLGGAMGIAICAALLARGTQGLHAEIAAGVTPLNRMLGLSGSAAWDIRTARGLALLDQEVTRQAQIIAYGNDYLLLMGCALFAAALVLAMRRPAVPAA